MKKTILAIALAVMTFNLTAQSTTAFTSVSEHYASLKEIDAAPAVPRLWMDTLSFPMKEYGRSALANTLLRTAYLMPEDEAGLATLISFPANSSAQTRAELDYLLDLQNKRSPAQVKRAEFIAEIGTSPLIINPLDSMYRENLRQLFYIAEEPGESYNPDDFPSTTRLLLNCIQDIRATEFRLKKHFMRARPYHLEPRLQPLARISSPSFPSGHTLWAFSQAYIFAEILPGQKQGFIRRAEEVRWSRELMGIHFPSDNEASRVISWHLLKFWLKNPVFVRDLNEARKEWPTQQQSLKK